jgi:hypothetical protein
MPINLQGKEYVTHEELVTWASAAGLARVETEILHFSISPPEAIVRATATGERGTFQGLGDCLPEVRGNVGRMVSAHWIRMAETRAINRALRLYTGRATTSIDELGERGHDAPPPRRAEPPRPAAPPKPAEKRGPTVGDLRRELKELWKARGIAGADARETIARRFDGATLEEIWSNGDALADLLATYEETEKA